MTKLKEADTDAGRLKSFVLRIIYEFVIGYL